MKLSKWIKEHSHQDLEKLAKKIKCHPRYLYVIAKKGCSAGLAKKIEAITMKLTPRNVISKHELRPDIWKKGE